MFAILIILFTIASSVLAGYAPSFVQCPTNSTLIREAKGVSPQEKAWLQERKTKANAGLVKFLKLSNLTYNAASLAENLNIQVALAFAGGGYRAMLNGAGQFAALDERTEFAKGTGLGGILQASTYISALSGGAWMLSSVLFNNFSSIDEIVLQDKNDLWDLTVNHQLINQTNIFGLYIDVLLQNLNGALTHLNFYPQIQADVTAKKNAGFNTSLTDYWGRGLSRQLLTLDDQNALFSLLRTDPNFSNHDIPFPLLTAVGRKPGSVVYNYNLTEVEFNPFEMGSYDPSLNTFTDLKYVGTKVSNGVPKNQNQCVVGFDNTGFVFGTSSSLFNEFLNTLVCPTCSLNFILKFFLNWFLTSLSKKYEDIALYSPNPFYQSKFASSNNISLSDTLYLIDGGLTGAVIPMGSVANTERAVDVVFAFDSSNDSEESWPNGTALITSYERQFVEQGANMVLPYIPNAETFVSQGLALKPTFFGCDAKNLTALKKNGVTPPLVIYIANGYYSFLSNTSTFDLTYTDLDMKGMIRNGIEQTTRNNGTLDLQWRSCVACALVRREEERQGIAQLAQCQQCFSKYCWGGTTGAGSGYTIPQNSTSIPQNKTLIVNKEEKKTSMASTLNIPWIILFGIVLFA